MLQRARAPDREEEIETGLVAEAKPAEQLGVSWICAQAVERRIHLERLDVSTGYDTRSDQSDVCPEGENLGAA